MAQASRLSPGGSTLAGLGLLGLEQQLVPKKPVATTNDEVASILKGLQLDRKFFFSRLDDTQTKDLVPPTPDLTREQSGDGNLTSSPSNRLASMKSKVQKKQNTRAAAKRVPDFDIYLGEALMPVLAQSLDSLCRQINRMKMQGDTLDPKVRARFNPLTWLAQQLLRRHPKGAKTPRRQAIYGNFRDWADLERGKREMLRRRTAVKDVFDGFLLRGVVQREDLMHVVDAIDDTLSLEGVLNGNKDVRRAFGGDGDTIPESPQGQVQGPRAKRDFFKGGGWSFEQFWHRLASIIMSQDIVPFSAIQRGIHLQQQQALMRSEAEEARKREDEERKRIEDEQRKQMEDYVTLYSEMIESEQIQSILTQDKVLTGDDVRPGDHGYEFEVPPNGEHVTLLYRLLVLLGFDHLEKEKDGKLDGQLRWWDDELAGAWSTLQEINHAEICDGVVEKETLEVVLTRPVGFMLLRNKIVEELEIREENRDPTLMGRRDRRSTTSRMEEVSLDTGNQKPSFETLCHRLGITMSRMAWLHRLFESFLQTDEHSTVLDCNYPVKPAAIKKTQMRALMTEVRPTMEEDEFEMRFRRIDQDSSGQVEFDEFVTWVREDEVRVAGAAPLQKMSFDELAVVYGQSNELIKYLHDRFQDRLPPNVRDDYPAHPKSLVKQEVRALIASLTPAMSDAEFERHFQMTTFSKKDSLDFDEFLEVLDLDHLPEEIRMD